MADYTVLKEIGERIRLRRKELKLTQEQLAELMDVSLQMISNLEQGKKAIRPENIIKLCSALESSADYILLGNTSDTEIIEFKEMFSALSYEDRKLLLSVAQRLANK